MERIRKTLRDTPGKPGKGRILPEDSAPFEQRLWSSLERQTFTPSKAGVRAPDQREILDGGHKSHRETATSGVSENIVGSRLVFVGGRRKGEVVTAKFRIGSGITGAGIGCRVSAFPGKYKPKRFPNRRANVRHRAEISAPNATRAERQQASCRN